MGTRQIDKYLAPELRQGLKKWIQISKSFVLFYSFIPLILLILWAVFICRTVISFIYKYHYRGKYQLASATDSLFCLEKEGNTLTMNTMIFVKGQTDIEKLREKFLVKIIDHEKENGYRPYQKLLWTLVQKFGFYTWEDTSSEFDIREHVKICPDAAEVDKIYSEHEIMEAVSKLTGKVINSDCKRPQWEFLFVPRLTREENGDLHYAIFFRVYHAYSDGISAINLLQKFLDTEGQYAINPMAQPTRKLTKLELLGHYAQVLILGPHSLYKMSKLKRDNIFQETEENEGPKFLSLTKMEMSMDSVKLIRKKFNCSTTAILTSVTSGAMRKAAERKGLPVPDEVDLGFTVAILPYPDDTPQNRFTIPCKKSPIAIEDALQRLRRSNALMRTEQYEVTTIYLMGKLLGLSPVWLNKKAMERMTSSFVLSNLPGLVDTVHVDGNPVEVMCGCPPIKNGVGFGVGISSYKGKLQALWIVEKTRIIANGTDVKSLVANFEKEFAHLEKLATCCEMNNN